MIEEIISQTKDLNKSTLPAFDEVKTMRNQALTHNTRSVKSNIFTERRPNETKDQYSYRLKNIRRFTQELPDKFLTKISRLFTSGGFWISSASEELQTYLEKEDIFFVNDSRVDYRSFIINRLIPESLISPNSLIMLKPVSNKGDLPPIDALPNNSLPKLKPVLIKYEDICFKSEDALIFRGKESIKLQNNKEYFILWAVDRKAWYKLTPKLIKNKDGTNKEAYDIDFWYVHNIGFINYTWLCGREKINEDGAEIRESYLYTAYEHLDEAILAISDDQAVRTKSAFPHIVMSEIECDECNGAGELNGHECGVCKGTKRKGKGGILDAFMVPPATLNQQESYLNPFIQFIAPDTGILEFIHKVAYDTFYKNAFQVVGLKSILDVSESGIAKSKRLEDLQDILRDISMSIKQMTESLLFQIECYLKSGRDKFVFEPISVRVPESYAALDNETISELIKDAKGMHRRRLFRQAFLIESGETKKNLKIIDSAMIYSPLLGLSVEEITARVQIGAYDSTDVQIMDNIIYIIQEISKENAGFIQFEYLQIKNLIDAKLAEYGLISAPIFE